MQLAGLLVEVLYLLSLHPIVHVSTPMLACGESVLSSYFASVYVHVSKTELHHKPNLFHERHVVWNLPIVSFHWAKPFDRCFVTLWHFMKGLQHDGDHQRFTAAGP